MFSHSQPTLVKSRHLNKMHGNVIGRGFFCFTYLLLVGGVALARGDLPLTTVQDSTTTTSYVTPNEPTSTPKLDATTIVNSDTTNFHNENETVDVSSTPGTHEKDVESTSKYVDATEALPSARENSMRALDHANDLSDVQVDDSEMMEHSNGGGGSTTTETDHNMLQHIPYKKLVADEQQVVMCEKNGKRYYANDKYESACDEICTCQMNGMWTCEERCKMPFFRKGKRFNSDPLCTERDSHMDACCSVLVCSEDTETEPLEICIFKNQTYHRGDIFHDGCSQTCTCEHSGNIDCRPRCPPVNVTASENCVTIQDTKDSCCKMVLCDVNEDENQSNQVAPLGQHPQGKIASAEPVNSTTIRLTVNSPNVTSVEISRDRQLWTWKDLTGNNLITDLDANKRYYLKIGDSSDIVDVKTMKEEAKMEKEDFSLHDGKCRFKGKDYDVGAEFHDGCHQYCMCSEKGTVCDKIECPSNFGLDVLDPYCLEWETIPRNFVPNPPHCCADQVRCVNNGSCFHNGALYVNYQEIPSNVSGCHQKCYCELGKVECQDICPPVSATPPRSLICKDQHAPMLMFMPNDDCCMSWACAPKKVDADIIDKNRTTESHTNKHIFLLPTPNPNDIKPQPTASLANVTNKKPSTNDIQSQYNGPFAPNYQQNPSNSNASKKKELNKKNQNKLNGFDKFLYGAAGKPVTTVEPIKVADENDVAHLSHDLPHNLPRDEDDDGLSHISNALATDTLNPSKKNKHKHGNPHIHPLPGGVHQNPNLVLNPNYHPSGAGNQMPSHFNGLDYEKTNAQNSLSPEELLHLIHEHNPSLLPPSGSVIQVTSLPNDQKIIPLQSFYPNLPNLFSPTAGVVPSLGHQINGSQDYNPLFPKPGFPYNPPISPPQAEITITELDALDPQTVRLVFKVPTFLVGLHGRVELRYTKTQQDNSENWEVQVFAPPQDLIATPQLEFELPGLDPDTEYKIKITLVLRDLHNAPSSRVYTVRTPPNPFVTSIPTTVFIDPDLKAFEVNATWVTLSWRRFSDEEMKFIDGVQVRYKELQGMVYTATPLIHRAVTTYTIDSLKPNTEYEVGLFFIPFHNQVTELRAQQMIRLTTKPESDIYDFEVVLDINKVKSSSVEMSWSGVPYPEDKYVNIYRAIYQNEAGKEEFSTFKIAKRDSLAKTIVHDLKPATKYRLWLEVYLTNGKIKTSNVQVFTTKDGVPANINYDTQQGKLAGTSVKPDDYSGPFITVTVIAIIATVATLVLLSLIMKRHTQHKASITHPSNNHLSQASYDNPTYKVEMTQETMNL